MPRPSTKGKYSFGDVEPRVSIHSVPFYLGIAVVAVLGGLFGIVYNIDGILPAPLNVADEPKNPDTFITERAVWNLHNLTKIGPRVVGSDANEIETVGYLIGQINTIKLQSHPNQFIEQDLQTTSGAYVLNSGRGLINSYNQVQNVIVKLNGQEGTAYSVLVNSHFDSVPTSPGASDDGINVAAMLEILRILSKRSERPLHNIVFLFNGAEETPLQASHGFVSEHKWAKECKVVLNLDACGSGGKIILFQSGPNTPWLIKYYSGVPHPYGQVAGEEFFQSGVLPSDTDYRIFRDYGNLVGLDMAFIKNGYRYHTKHDGFGYIPLGSYQHVGDNALYLVRTLANAPEVAEAVPSEGRAVYYDVFGWFMIYYTDFVGSIVNVLAVILSLTVFTYSLFSFKLAFSKPALKFLPIATGAILGSWTLAILFVYILSVILDLVGRTMSWFTNSWLLFGLYSVPTIGLSGSLLFLTNHENISLNIRCQIQAHLVRLILTVILALGVALSVRAVYALMIPVVFSSLAFIVIHAARIHHSVKKWQLVYVLFMVIPIMNLMYQSLITLSLLIPITGFIGSNKNPDIILGLLVAFFTILVTSPLTALTNSLRDAKYYFIVLGSILILTLVLIFTPLGFPYSASESYPTPQRQWIMHTSRKFFNETGDLTKTDSGFFFLNLDRNSPRILKNYVPELAKAASVHEDCAKYAGCGMPLSHHRMVEIAEYSSWVPAQQPELPEPVEMNFVAENISSNLVRYNITVTGPDRMTVYLVPQVKVNVEDISLVGKVQPSTVTFHGRSMYFLYYQMGKGNSQFSFSFNVSVPGQWQGPTVNLTVVGRYVHPDKMQKTPQFLQLLDKMPDWTDVVAWLGTNYVYQI